MILGYAYNDELSDTNRTLKSVRETVLCEPLLLNAGMYTRTHFPVEHGLLLYDR